MPDGREIPLNPQQSVLEVLFANKLRKEGGGMDCWKRINELWSGGNVVILVKDILGNEDVDMSITSRIDCSSIPPRVRLALKLLDKFPFKTVNDTLNSKLSKELDSALLVSVNGISPHWIITAQKFPFLFDFATRVNLMKSVCLGSIRSTNLLYNRVITSTNPNRPSTPSLPRRKFRIDRSDFMKCLRYVFAPVNDGDSRSFEFEYIDELGSGHGPTMEFYALASKEITRPSLGLMHVTRPCNLEADEIIEIEGEGIFPSWSSTIDHCDEFRILGSLMARSLLDDRIINIPLNPIFYSNCAMIQLNDLKFIDPELFSILSDQAKMIGHGIPFNVPGTEIPLSLGVSDRTINGIDDYEEFTRLFIERVNQKLLLARDSFLQGFNSTFTQSFDYVTSFFSPRELLHLFGPSWYCGCNTEWTFESIKSSLIPDHGYRSDSPQINWLAEILSETSEQVDRIKLVQFLTGAAYLPVGGWKSLRPPLTIVCKTFSEESSPSIPNSNTNLSSSSSISSTNIENHDIYLPSVMTCANYLKLPRYSSKAIMRDRIGYAIKEGCESFYLS